jgi:hypothetical protein
VLVGSIVAACSAVPPDLGFHSYGATIAKGQSSS